MQSESEVRMFGESVSRVSGKGKGSGQIGGLGVGGMSGAEEIDGSGGLGVGGSGCYC